MQAIETKYIPPTETKPARIKAWFRNDDGRARSVTVSSVAGSYIEWDHARAVHKLIQRYISEEYQHQWLGDEWAVGDTLHGYVFCRSNRFRLAD